MAEKILENKTGVGLAPILFAALAAVLTIAFFSRRGSDAGQLQTLVQDIGGGPLFGLEGFRDSVLGCLIALLIGVSWFGLGSLILKYIDLPRADGHSHLLELALATSIGAAIWSLIWCLLGFVGAYSGGFGITAILCGTALAGLSRKRIRQARVESRTPSPPDVFDRIVLAMIAIPVALALVASLAPPTAKDTLLYHFALPKAFLAQGNIAVVEGNIASYLALGTEMHAVWAMLAGNLANSRVGEAAASVVTFAFFPLVLMTIFGWARQAGVARGWAVIATLMAASVPTAFHVASSAYVDLALALFVTLAIYGLCRWWSGLEKGWLILIAVFLGAALSIKLTAVFIFAAFALVIALRARVAEGTGGGAGRVFASGSAALVLAAVIASPWYLRTWAETGSPVFPFYMSIWKGEAPGWDVERSNLFQGMNSQYGGVNKTALDYLAAPWNLSVAAQPEAAEYFDGVLGIGFLFGLPILIWGLWKYDLSVEVKIAAGIAGIMFLFWLFSSQQLRYLLPVLPALAVGIVASAQAISKNDAGLASVWRYSLMAAGLAGIVVTCAWFLQREPVRVALGGETREAYLTRKLDYYAYYDLLNNTTAPDAKVWLINMRRDTYDLDRPVFSDYLFEDWTLRKMVWDSRTSRDLRAKAAATGARYILTRHDFLFDYDRSSLVDDRRPRAENEEKLRIARELILDPERVIRSDNKFSLIKVF